MGSVVKGVASLFGGGKRRREQKAANRQLNAIRILVMFVNVNIEPAHAPLPVHCIAKLSKLLYSNTCNAHAPSPVQSKDVLSTTPMC